MKAFLSRVGFRAAEQTSLDTPPTGQRTLVPKSDGWYDVDDAGTETQLGGGSAVDSVNGHTGTVVLAASDVGAVPTTRTINGHALSSNVVLTAADIGVSTAGNVAVFCGDGSDGNVTISTTVTLTRDMFYDTLTVSSGGTLNTAGFRVHCRTACVVNSGGTISFNGNNATANTAGSGVTAKTAGGTNAGGAGASPTPNGSGGTSNLAASFGGRGGSGGGVSGSGGPSGTVTALTAAQGGPTPRTLAAMTAGVTTTATPVQFTGGSGGAGGGGTGSGGTIGGGGGAGGGVIILNAPAVTNNGTISANGGNGGNGTIGSGTGAGGGGGGGGGAVIINATSFTGTTPVANGGNGGTKVGTSSTDGSAGAAGTVLVTLWT